jgi:hypothetical protein
MRNRGGHARSPAGLYLGGEDRMEWHTAVTSVRTASGIAQKKQVKGDLSRAGRSGSVKHCTAPETRKSLARIPISMLWGTK